MRIAVVGAGVAGVVSAHLLQNEHEVVLFEANDYIGGHTNTKLVPSGPDEGTAVDTGFIVLNDKTYPLFHSFLADLDVPVRWSDMSFGYYCEDSGLQYAGTTVNGLFAQRKNLIDKRFWSFLSELRRFCKNSLKSRLHLSDDISLGNYLRSGGYSDYFVRHYLFPMAAAIWSAPSTEILNFPARSFLNFFHNHGLLSLSDRPRWQTVDGGSHRYVQKFLERFTGKVFLKTKIDQIVRDDQRVTIISNGGERDVFDSVVIATHADQALRLLAQPSEDELRLLGAWHYQKNHAVLHTDSSILPPLRRSWASWNYLRAREDVAQQPVAVTYYMNLLQGLDVIEDYCVTLNCVERIDPKKILFEMNYEHPQYNYSAVSSQAELKNLQGRANTYFCGSYFGYGFHEDAVRSAFEMAKRINSEIGQRYVGNQPSS